MGTELRRGRTGWERTSGRMTRRNRIVVDLKESMADRGIEDCEGTDGMF